MRKPTKAGFALVIAFSAFAAAQTSEQSSKLRPAPEMQKLAKMLVGTWRVDQEWAPGGSKPKGGKGTAHSVIRLGPGGFSVIEDFVGSDVDLHSLIWWDKAARCFKTAGCDDSSDQGCQMENGRGRWEGNQVVWQLTVPKDGKDVPAKIVWAEKDSRSFAATMYVADASGNLKTGLDIPARPREIVQN